MVTPVRSLRVLAMPASPRPNTLYFVRPDPATPISLFVTGADGVAQPVLPPPGFDDPGDLAAVFNSA